MLRRPELSLHTRCCLTRFRGLYVPSPPLASFCYGTQFLVRAMNARELLQRTRIRPTQGKNAGVGPCSRSSITTLHQTGIFRLPVLPEAQDGSRSTHVACSLGSHLDIESHEYYRCICSLCWTVPSCTPDGVTVINDPRRRRERSRIPELKGLHDQQTSPCTDVLIFANPIYTLLNFDTRKLELSIPGD